MLYAQDYSERIPDGDTSDRVGSDAGFEVYNRSSVGQSATYRVRCWVGRPMNEAGAASNMSLDDKIRGYRAGSIWPYIEAPKAYNCPADTRFRGFTASGQMKGYRSYSIGKPLSKRFPGNPGEVDCEITKISEFVLPSSKIIFLEEAEQVEGWNHRTWNMDLINPNWTDPFSINHNDSSTFVFADGHADRHKWLEEQTKKMAEEGVKNRSAIDPLLKTYEDWKWMKSVYIPGRKPASVP
jgi:prepilin-type processing-associated H-X9-DG protein